MSFQTKLAKVSFHGHSNYSDGLESVDKIVQKAAAYGINYFGLSDHNTTVSIAPLFVEIEKINKTLEAKIVPIAAVEITFRDKEYKFDAIFALPGEYNEKFVDWCRECVRTRWSCSPIELISKTVKDFNALIVFPHPEMHYASSVKIPYLRDLASKLSPEIKKNIGIEARNWTSNIYPQNKKREAKLPALAEELGLAQFGLADFHVPEDINNQYSIAKVDDLTASSLIKAVQERQIEPAPATKVGFGTWRKIFWTICRAVVRQKIKGKDLYEGQ